MASGAQTGADVEAFVEQVARDAAAEGVPRAAGRIFGLLLVSDGELSLDAITSGLQASKGSVSAEARRLAQRGVLELVKRPGDRRDYYRVPADLFVRMMEMRLSRWRAFHAVIRAGRQVAPPRSAAVRRRFEDLDGAYTFVTRAIEDALARWHGGRPRRAPATRARRRSSARLALGALALASLAAATSLAAQQAPAPSAVALTLGGAARLAARQSAPADEARSRAAAANERIRLARADLLPVIGAAALDGRHTLNSAAFGISLPGFDPEGQVLGPIRAPDLRVSGALSLFDLAALRRVHSAGSTAQAADAEAAAVADDAATRAALAYIASLRAEALVGARSADSTLAAELLGIARQQTSAGVGVALDVTRAEAQLAEARSDLIAARRDRDLGQLALLRRLGLPLGATVQLVDPLDGPALTEPVPAADSAVARALHERPDVRAAAAAGRAATDRLAAIRGEYLPTVSVFGDQGLTGKSYAHLLRTYAYGIKVSVPLFDGLRRSARAGEQAALVREADARQRDAREQAEAEVQGALLDLASGREQVAAVRERLRLAEQEYGQARERFRTGVAGSADVVQSSLALNRARTRLVDALVNLQSARVALARAQGAVTLLP